MGYRDASESLRAYRDRIAGDLEQARLAARDAAEQGKKVSVLERELAETEGLLDKMGGKRRGLPMLESVQVAAPCSASWDDMVGDDHVRFCGHCEKNVYNLSSLPREEAEALLLVREGSLCVRMYRRQDGTVLTADCPVGVKKRRRRRAAVAAVGGGLMAAASLLGLDRALGAKPAPVMGDSAMTMGTPAIQGTAAPTTPPVESAPAELGQGVRGGWTAGAPLMGKPANPPRPPAGTKVIQGRR